MGGSRGTRCLCFKASEEVPSGGQIDGTHHQPYRPPGHRPWKRSCCVRLHPPPQKMQQQRVRPRSKLEIGPMSVNDICCMIPPWFGASAPWNPCEITTRFPRAVITSSRVGFLGVLGMLVKSLLKGLKMSSATSRSGGRELGSEGFCSAMEAFQSLVRIKTSSILDTSIAVRVIQRDTWRCLSFF